MDKKSKNKNPNILFICSDQHRFDCTGVNSERQPIKTPNLDKLAASGMNFNHAYTPSPICTPARASLLTGQWSFSHLSITIPQWTEAPRAFKKDLVTFPELLKDKDYWLGYVGKWHISDNSGKPQPEDLGFDEYIPESDYFAWRSKQDISLTELHSAWNQDLTPGEFDQLIRGGVDTEITPDQAKLSWSADQIIRLLEDCADKEESFFVSWAPSEPHLTNIVPEPYASMYNPDDIEPWGSFGDSMENKPYMQKQQIATWNIGNWTWQDWASVVARYLGEISLMDQAIGKVLDSLETLGLADNTVIIYTTDHGDMCGSHGMIDKNYVMYDDVTRVPLIIKWPGVINEGSSCDYFVSHAIDLATTICEMTKCDIPETFQGESLLPLLKDEDYKERQDILSNYHGAQFGLYSQRMIRNKKWKYIWNCTACDELYNLDNDPWELDNRIKDAKCTEQLQQLRMRLITWMEETGDPLLNRWTRSQLEQGWKI